MSRLPVTTMLLLIHLMVAAQNPEIDSLLNAVTTDIPDRQKVDALNQVAFRYLGFDSVSTAKYAGQAIAIAEKINYAEGTSDAYYAIGWVTMVFGHSAAAIDLFNRVLAISEKAGYVRGLANAHNGLGDANRNLGNYTESLDHHLKALTLREELGDQGRVASSLNNIGIIYYSQRDYDKALEYYEKGLDIRKEVGDLRQIAVSYNNIGIVMLAKDEFQKALEYYQQCVEINLSLGDKADVARNYHNIGVVYSDKLQNARLGLEYFSKALSIYRELGDKGSMTYPLIAMGGAYMYINELAAARKYTLEGIKLSEEAQLLINVNDGFKILSEIEAKAGDYKAAFGAFTRYKELSDQLINEEQTKALALKEAEYKFEKEKDQIEREKLAIAEELKREQLVQYAAFGGIVVLLVLLSILTQFYRVKKHSNAVLVAKNQEIQQHRDELEKLNNAKTRFFSIISHDLRSPVNSFFGMFDLIKFHLHDKYQAEKDGDLNEMIEHLKKAGNQMTTLLNNLIAWALKEEGMMPYNPTQLNVSSCLRENVAVLELNALSKQIELKIEADEATEVWADKNSFMTILRNLTSNAIKFTPSGGIVKLSAEKTNGKVKIEILDSGVGIEAEKLTNLFEVNEKKTTRGTEGEKGTGLGLNLVHDFVRMNKGDIQVTSHVGVGTTFKIELPSKATN